MPFAVAAGIGAVATIGGALIQGNAASSAANAQEQAAQNATNAQLQMFNTTQNDYKNQIALGGGASQLLENLYGTNGKGTPNYSAFYNSPGYQFALKQGQSAVDRSAAASGGLYSSNTLAALGANQQGIASTQYNSYVNQLLSMAGLGNTAASGVGSAATATGQGIANNYTNAGNAAANGALGQANAFSNALGSGNSGISGLLGNYYGSNYQYNGEFGPNGSTGANGVV